MWVAIDFLTKILVAVLKRSRISTAIMGDNDNILLCAIDDGRFDCDVI